jgi:hypothetical protein
MTTCQVFAAYDRDVPTEHAWAYSGTVTDANLGDVIPGAQVAVSGVGTALTDANGTYTITNVPSRRLPDDGDRKTPSASDCVDPHHRKADAGTGFRAKSPRCFGGKPQPSGYSLIS